VRGAAGGRGGKKVRAAEEEEAIDETTTNAFAALGEEEEEEEQQQEVEEEETEAAAGGEEEEAAAAEEEEEEDETSKEKRHALINAVVDKTKLFFDDQDIEEYKKDLEKLEPAALNYLASHGFMVAVEQKNPENRDLFYDTVVQFYEEKFLTPAHIKKSFDFLFARAADEKCDNPKFPDHLIEYTAHCILHDVLPLEVLGSASVKPLKENQQEDDILAHVLGGILAILKKRKGAEGLYALWKAAGLKEKLTAIMGADDLDQMLKEEDLVALL